MTQHTIFFDLDGTLTDPSEGIVGCIRYALTQMDAEQPPGERLRECIGPPLLESFIDLVGTEGAQQAVDHYRDRFSHCGWQENRRYPGIIDGLRRLTAANVNLFVATSKPTVFANQIIDHFELRPYFTRVFGSEFDGTRSNKADLLKFALEHANAVGTPIMVGDRKHDVIGAKANAMRTVGVTYGFGSRVELQTAGADDVMSSVEALMAFLADSTAS